MRYEPWKMEEAPFEEFLGKTLIEVKGLKVEGVVVEFTCDDGTKFVMFHDQDCCEYVRIDDVVGDVSSLINTPITFAEVVTNESDDEDNYGTHTWTFYKLATIRGYVDIKWLGESNGYYSESVDFYRLKVEKE